MGAHNEIRQTPRNTLKSGGFRGTLTLLSRSEICFGREAVRVLAAQAGLTLTASVVLALVSGWAAGGWVLLGGLVCVGPSALQAARLCKASKPGGNFGAALLLGELVKVGFIGGLFAIIFANAGNVNPLALLIGFIAAVQGYFLALLFK